MVLHVAMEVLNWFLKPCFSNYLKSGSRKMMKRYGLSDLLCNIAPLLIRIGGDYV